MGYEAGEEAVTARARWRQRIAEGLARQRQRRAEAWTCTPSEILPGEVVTDGCGVRHRTRAKAEECARQWTRRKRRPVTGLPARGRDAILPAVPVHIDRKTWRRLPSRSEPEADAEGDALDALVAISRRAREQRTCGECGHVREGLQRGRCPTCGAAVPGFGVDRDDVDEPHVR